MFQRFPPGLLAAALAFVLFTVLAVDGLKTAFTGDDVMNLYGYWFKPAGAQVWDLLWPPRAAFRPAGALFYRPLFSLAGFDPAPYRAVSLALAGANLLLAFAFVRTFSGSTTLAGLTVLLLSYHAHLADLYYCSSTVYDLFGFFCFYFCLWLYMRVRVNDCEPGVWGCAGFAILQWIGLAAKENIAALPAVILAYEALRGGQRRLRTAVVLAVAAAVYMTPRLFGSGAMVSNPAYRLDLTPAAYLANLHRHLEHVVYMPGKLPEWVFAAATICALGAALLLRNRNLMFAWLLAFLSSLPVMFLPPRGLFVMYIACTGIAMFVAELLRLGGRLLRDWWDIHPRAAYPAVAALALLLYAQHSRAKPKATEWIGPEQAKISRLLDAARRQPRPPEGSKVLLLNSPFIADDWTAVLLLRLYYRDEHLRGVWVPGTVAPPSEEPFSAVLDAGGGTNGRAPNSP